ncbi:hypothetical protein P9I23_000111 [Campylobacter fetus]|nr:hypothetical protein [Campylobacter fetus]EKR8079523.1 hypothetical protein [Campylobacter fetus]
MKQNRSKAKELYGKTVIWERNLAVKITLI